MSLQLIARANAYMWLCIRLSQSSTEALHRALPKLYKSSTKALHEPLYKALQSSAHAVNRARSPQRGGSKGVSPLSLKIYSKLCLKLDTEL